MATIWGRGFGCKVVRRPASGRVRSRRRGAVDLGLRLKLGDAVLKVGGRLCRPDAIQIRLGFLGYLPRLDLRHLWHNGCARPRILRHPGNNVGRDAGNLEPKVLE